MLLLLILLLSRSSFRRKKKNGGWVDMDVFCRDVLMRRDGGQAPAGFLFALLCAIYTASA